MKWSEEKTQQLHDLAFAGKSNKEIADALHVELVDVYAKRSQLGITRAKVAAAKGEKPAPAVTQQSSKTERLIHALRTHGPGCYGCGHEHNCRENGCALMQLAADELERLDPEGRGSHGASD
jgi:hypothetical protein